MSSRFVAGMNLEDVLRAAANLNAQGISATLDSLGENVHTADEARRSADIYHRLLDSIHERRLDANISVKLTQMGLELDRDLTFEIVSQLVKHAASVNNFVRVDMEGTDYTDITLELVRTLHAQEINRGHVGIVIQAYLYRSEADIQQFVKEGIRIRLCKGAYQEPPNLAFPAKTDVDANFVKLTRILLASGIFHGIATHDEAMIDAARQAANELSIDRHGFEFQMLYGVRRDLQRALVKEGFGMRVYIPFGTEWYPYFMRRLAERPANVLFLARSLLHR